MNLKYEQPRRYSRLEVEKIKTTGNEVDIYRMLLGVVYYEDDFSYMCEVILFFENHDSPGVVATIFECLGHMARLHGKLPEDKVFNIYDKYKNSDDSNIQCRVECFMDDVEIFMPNFYKKLSQ